MYAFARYTWHIKVPRSKQGSDLYFVIKIQSLV